MVSFASFSTAHQSIAFVDEDVHPHEGGDDDPVISGEIVPPNLWGLFEILKTKFKAVHKIMRVFRPEPNLVQ
ncbi:hypothetical protein AMTR_s00006p00128990 [Amborella trichopoda]|uniref:Uncharacterized protein n=1 Tax=Amborella trichopoda TaxID=13333 RepID=W1PD78_AMBTC|nr:hypothetical protein AMTR_s00006p00128990 [Amborella trichopoda]